MRGQDFGMRNGSLINEQRYFELQRIFPDARPIDLRQLERDLNEIRTFSFGYKDNIDTNQFLLIGQCYERVFNFCLGFWEEEGKPSTSIVGYVGKTLGVSTWKVFNDPIDNLKHVN